VNKPFCVEEFLRQTAAVGVAGISVAIGGKPE
jgi:hypothetical protein